MSDAASGNPLYDAAVGFLVSERTGSDAWAKVAEFAANYPAIESEHINDTLARLKKEFTVVEKQVRKDFKVSRLPAAWRSAKSTAISALRLNIPLLDKDKAAQPKTDVSKLIKATKSGIITLAPVEKLKQHVAALLTIYASLTGPDHADATLHMIGIGTAAGMVMAPKHRVRTMAAASSS